MDKVNNSSRQAKPLWDRQQNQRGHRSAVDGALKAHRQRAMERQSRVQERLDMVKQIQSDFFPTPSAQERDEFQQTQSQNQVQPMNAPAFNTNQQIVDQMPDLNLIEGDSFASFQPQTMDEIYSEAQLGTTSDNALAVVQKDLANPEEGPVEDMPKGSYIDYTV